MGLPPPRDAGARHADSLARLETDVDLWIATAGSGGEPCLVPLSFLWDGAALLVATAETNPTARNLLASGTAKVAVGATRDVVLVDVTVVATTPAAEIDEATGDAFAAKTGFDPRRLSRPYVYFRLAPRRLQAWREANELAGRDLMREGQWLV
jgi:hypothetical protein